MDASSWARSCRPGAGQNPARQSAIGAGIGWNVPTVTINKVCLSGLTAVIDAARMIRSGDADRGGGRRPGIHDPRPPCPPRLPPGLELRRRPGPGRCRPRRPDRRLRRPVHGPVHRAQEPASSASTGPPRTTWPPQSHQRAAAAAKDGVFDDEIVPDQRQAAQGRSRGAHRRRGRPAGHHGRDPGRPAGRLRHRRNHHRRQLLSPVRRRRRPGADLPQVRRGQRPGVPGRGRQARARSPDRTTPCTPSPPTPSRTPWTRPAGAPRTWTSSRSTRPSVPWPCSP